MGSNKVVKRWDFAHMAQPQRISLLKLARTMLLALLALEMGKQKVLVKAAGSDHISLSSLLASKIPQRDEILRQPLLRCALLGSTKSRQDCEQQLLYFLNDISQENRAPIAQLTTGQSQTITQPQRPVSLQGLNPVEYLNLIQNCISKCDGWGSRVNYQNCIKSCQRENSLLQQTSLTTTSECSKARCQRQNTGVPTQMAEASDCPYGRCGTSRGQSWQETTASKRRKDNNCDGGLCGLDQLRKRRWGDTLTTCIASYCNSLNGDSRVGCIINKCDKQRRG